MGLRAASSPIPVSLLADNPASLNIPVSLLGRKRPSLGPQPGYPLPVSLSGLLS